MTPMPDVLEMESFLRGTVREPCGQRLKSWFIERVLIYTPFTLRYTVGGF
jgi:hypothetical protein